MDFDLDRMGWRQFEHLVQALSLDILGNGVQIFGDGIDGGREATFDGPLDFPEGDGEKWSGYGVVQAKHHTFPSDDLQKNADSAIKQIQTELSDFLPNAAGVAKRSRTPEYYLFATNVRLSPKEEKGGLDRVEAELEIWRKKLGMKGVFVWHYANICRMLEGRDGIRRSFAGFITPGDVLSDLITYLGVPTASVGALLRTNAAQQIRTKQWIELGESGGDNDDRIALSKVGIDLPAVISVDIPNEKKTESQFVTIQGEVKVLKYILARGDLNLRSDYEADAGIGLVLVGGPGQGKSTIGHLICQAYRAALLTGGTTAWPANVRSVIDATRNQLDEMDIPLPTNKRWPVYVRLSEYGDALTANPETSLLKFIASKIKVEGDVLKTNQLNKWKADWPWLLVLDGLDEVAATETRRLVVTEIADFVTESRARDHDVLVVATTRPQGYHGEFAEFEPEQLNLRGLKPGEGEEYGNRLLAIRHADDPDKLPDLAKRLHDAAYGETTSRLMRSPLQITIMTILLESFARIPNTKHALYEAYYDTIYRREVGRAGNLGQLLETHREYIDYLHEQVGLDLQIRSERAGGSEALMSDLELKAIFARRLEEDQYEQKDIVRLSSELLNAAKNRIVLLVSRKADHVAFEVRALQEYMAARALAEGADEDVLDRIDALAPSSYWRHTSLLLISRAFGKRHLRDSIVGRIRQLDAGEPAGAFLGFGEALAIDLLEDELAVNIPKVRRALLQQGLASLRRWPKPELQKLATVLKPFLEDNGSLESDIVTRALTEAYESAGRAQIGAVMVLRVWQGQPGFAGALANRLLVDDAWRPQPNDTPDDWGTYSVGTAIAGQVNVEELVEHIQAEWTALIDVLNEHLVLHNVSSAEAGSLATRTIPLAEVDELDQLVKNPEVMRRLESAIEALSIDDAVAASWLQQAINLLNEREPVGTHPALRAALGDQNG